MAVRTRKKSHLYNCFISVMYMMYVHVTLHTNSTHSS